MDNIDHYSIADLDFNFNLQPQLRACEIYLQNGEDSPSMPIQEIVNVWELSDPIQLQKPVESRLRVDQIIYNDLDTNNFYEDVDRDQSKTYLQNYILPLKNKINENYNGASTQSCTKDQEKPLYAISVRACFNIKTTSAKDNKYSEVRKGANTETRCLQNNFYKINLNLLCTYDLIKGCCQFELQRVRNFQANKASFSTTQKLFGLLNHQQKNVLQVDGKSDRLRRNIERIYSRPVFIREILKSEIRFSEKLRMVKFGEKLRQAVLFPQFHSNWKNDGNCSRQKLLKQEYLTKALNN